MSFFDVTKYPPSLLFALITLSVPLLLLSFNDSKFFTQQYWIVRFVALYGKAALFYYIAHLAVIFLIGEGLRQFNQGSRMISSQLALTFLISIIVISLLYPVIQFYCRWRDKHKQQFAILNYI
jgi:hypothetical protein